MLMKADEERRGGQANSDHCRRGVCGGWSRPSENIPGHLEIVQTIWNFSGHLETFSIVSLRPLLKLFENCPVHLGTFQAI